MADTSTEGLTPLAKLVVVLGAALLILGAVWHGVTFDELKASVARVYSNIRAVRCRSALCCSL